MKKITRRTANGEMIPRYQRFFLSFPSNNVVCPGISDLVQGLAYSDSLGAIRSGDRIPVGGRDFLQAYEPGGPTQPPVQWVPCLFPGGKAAGVYRQPPTAI